MSVTSILVLIIVITLFFRIEIPMCYNTAEPKPPETFVLYAREVVEEVKQEIEKNPFYYLRISGNSMQPAIKSGDTCVCIPRINYNEGDIISFYIPVDNQVELIAHRIKGKDNNKFITKGDNNNIQDSWVLDEEQIFCKIPEKNLFEKFKFAMVDSGGRFGIFSVLG